MGENSKIQWTDHTFSPWWGCQRVSEACRFCYAESFSRRVGHGKRLPTIWGASNTERRFFRDSHWREPIKWNRKAKAEGIQRRVFCASMSDVFEDRDDLIEHRERLGQLILETPWLIWMLLTKRPENIERLIPRNWSRISVPENVWLGATLESLAERRRVTELLRAPSAKVKFLSCEPLLENVAGEIAGLTAPICPDCYKFTMTEFCTSCDGMPENGLALGRRGVQLVIIGGESGGNARPFHVSWATSLIRACRNYGAAPFLKQLGANAIGSDGNRLRLKDSHGGDWDEWPVDMRVREWPT